MSAVMADVVSVRVAERTWRSEARAVHSVWHRDLIRFVGNRAQTMTWQIQPLLFLFVLGSGLQSLAAASTGGVDLKTFMFPGVICVAVLFTAMISAASFVWIASSGSSRSCSSRRSAGPRSCSASAWARRRSRGPRA
jgi:ABC-2 type transport system permease protein